MVEHRPGLLSRYFMTFVGLPDDEVDFIGRYENLVDDLCHALLQAGEEFNRDALLSALPVNTSAPPSSPVPDQPSESSSTEPNAKPTIASNPSALGSEAGPFDDRMTYTSL